MSKSVKRLFFIAYVTFLAFETSGQNDNINFKVSANFKKVSKRHKKLKNVLFIVVDDLRTSLRCYGDNIAITPNIDRLSKTGTVFTKAYAQQAVCSPSRSSFLTGMRPNTTKVWDLKTHFRIALPDVVTLPLHFKQNGYFVQSIGKIFHGEASLQDSVSWSAPGNYNHKDNSPKTYAQKDNLIKPSGFFKATVSESADVADTSYLDGVIASEAIKILNNIKSKPFFLAVGFKKPHAPFNAPKKYWDMYERDKILLPANPNPPLNVPEIALHNWTEIRGYSDIPKMGPVSAEKAKEIIHGYYASTSYMDAQVGKLLDELDRLGLTNNTIVVFLSDHGYHLGEHNLWGKTSNFEQDTRVPLIIASPGQKKRNASTKALVELVDIYPTLAQLAGLPVLHNLEGTSMAPLLNNPALPWKKAAFSQFPRPENYNKKDNNPEVMGYTIRTKNFRYTEWQNFKTKQVLGQELYDHRLDPSETINVVDNRQQKENIKRLTEMLNKGWQQSLPPLK